MLEKLASEISKKFNIEKKEAITLIKSKTLESLDNLKDQVKENSDSELNKLSKSELEKLFLTLK
ncbi:MAG: hypothetical protein LBQ59_02645 [Candidatus Peribacteria bacterium]|jgi:hypothetical protein|nr:hypothetical protein [Candidatus Peribacteria bacterium]